MLVALVLGIGVGTITTTDRIGPGLNLMTGRVMRLGIILLGTRVTLHDVLALGIAPLLAVAAIVAVTIAAGVAVSRLLRLSTATGFLLGCAVAICGASAALAVAAVIDPKRFGDVGLPRVLIGIALASATAMTAYPVMAHLLGFSDLQAGFLFGASIHDVAQAIGAGFAFSPEAARYATIVKLFRVVLLVPVVLAAARLFHGGDVKGPKIPFPWFVMGFLMVVAANSLGLIPIALGERASSTSTALLAVAVASTGLKAPIASLKIQTWRVLAAILATSIGMCLIATLVASRIGG